MAPPNAGRSAGMSFFQVLSEHFGEDLSAAELPCVEHRGVLADGKRLL
jgi:hypothetical protein